MSPKKEAVPSNVYKFLHYRKLAGRALFDIYDEIFQPDNPYQAEKNWILTNISAVERGWFNGYTTKSYRLKLIDPGPLDSSEMYLNKVFDSDDPGDYRYTLGTGGNVEGFQTIFSDQEVEALLEEFNLAVFEFEEVDENI